MRPRPGDQGRPSVGGTCVASAFAILLTYTALFYAVTPDPNNIPGTVIIDAGLVLLALWVDWHVIRRWREIASGTHAHDRRRAPRGTSRRPTVPFAAKANY